MAKIIQPLTNTQVEKAKYITGNKAELNDGGGLFLQLCPSSSKIWRFRYSHPVKQKRTKLTILIFLLLKQEQKEKSLKHY